MKILVFGDIHGRTIWKDIISKENPDLTIFLGDYISSHYNISEENQISNLIEILNYKEANFDSVILLRGNHDTSVFYWGECYPNFFRIDLFPIERFEQLTQWIYIKDNIIFSHAGVSKTFLKNNNLTLKELENIKEFNNSLFAFTPENKFSCNDYYGTSASYLDKTVYFIKR